MLVVCWRTGDEPRRHVAIQAVYLWELSRSLREHGIEIAGPVRDLRLRSAFGLEGEQAERLLLPGVDPGHASPAAGTQAPERRARSANDATEDTKRRIAADEAIRRRAEEDAARPPPTKTGPARRHPPPA